MTPTARRAIVVGGSLGGLFAANLLLRAGWDVHVYERAGEALSGRGAGIVTHPELRDALHRAGVRVDATLGVPVPGRVTLARDGSLVGERAEPQVLTSWGRLYHLLAEAFPAERYHFGCGLERVEQDAAGVTALFANGQRERGDLLVAADGIRSTVRAQFSPGASPVYAGYVAWRGLVEERALSPATHRALFERFAFCLPPGEQMLGYPVPGAGDSVTPGARRWNFVWYRPADEATELPALLTDDGGRRHAFTIPPNLVAERSIAAMRRDAAAKLSPQFAEVVDATTHPFLQPIFDLESPELAFGRVALLGDAAFVARPHCGMGVTKAGSDAVSLLDHLSRAEDVPAAVRAYAGDRGRFGHFIVGHARALGAYMQAQIRTPTERAAAEQYRTPEAVMRETAVPPA